MGRIVLDRERAAWPLRDSRPRRRYRPAAVRDTTCRGRRWRRERRDGCPGARGEHQRDGHVPIHAVADGARRQPGAHRGAAGGFRKRRPESGCAREPGWHVHARRRLGRLTLDPHTRRTARMDAEISDAVGTRHHRHAARRAQRPGTLRSRVGVHGQAVGGERHCSPTIRVSRSPSSPCWPSPPTTRCGGRRRGKS